MTRWFWMLAAAVALLMVDARSARADEDALPMPDLQRTLWNETTNHAPVLEPISLPVLSVGRVVTFKALAHDSDGESLFYVAYGLPRGATFDNRTGRFRWYTRGPAFHTVSIGVSDGQAYDLQTVTLQVGATRNQNRPPRIQTVDHLQMTAGYESAAQLHVADPDGDDVRIAFETRSGTFGKNAQKGLPRGAKYDRETGAIYWTPDCNQAGHYEIVVVAYDTAFGSRGSAATLSVDVQAPTDAYAGGSNSNQIVGRWKVVDPAPREPGRFDVLVFDGSGHLAEQVVSVSDKGVATRVRQKARYQVRGAEVLVREHGKSNLDRGRIQQDGTRVILSNFLAHRRLELARCEDAACTEEAPRPCSAQLERSQALALRRSR